MNNTNVEIICIFNVFIGTVSKMIAKIIEMLVIRERMKNNDYSIIGINKDIETGWTFEK